MKASHPIVLSLDSNVDEEDEDDERKRKRQGEDANDD